MKKKDLKLVNGLWQLWENLAKAGEIGIGPSFHKYHNQFGKKIAKLNGNTTHHTAVAWATLENFEGEKKLKQHAFVPDMTHGNNEGHTSLCGRIGMHDDDFKSVLFNTVIYESELINHKIVCPDCLRIYNNLVEITK